MGYQATVLSNGSIAAVYAANLGLSPGPVATGIHVLPRTFGPARTDMVLLNVPPMRIYRWEKQAR